MFRFLLVLLLIITLYGEDKLYKNGERFYFSKGCSSCHGVDATGLHNYPSLAKRSKWDLKRRLFKLRKGVETSQQSSMMIPFAKNLSNQEINAITYFLENITKNDNEESYDIEYESWGDGGS